jgi:L-fuculose-phosphate aldolase
MSLFGSSSRLRWIVLNGVRAVIIRNHGVVSIGNNIYQARAVIESLEEWAKIYTISKIFGGPKYVL